MKKLLSILFLTLIMVSFVSAIYNFKQDDNVNFRFRCFDLNNEYCSASTILVISVEDPDGTNAMDNVSMTANGTYFNISLPTEKIGQYSAIIASPGNNATSEFPYLISTTGTESTTGKGILYVILIVVFFLLFLGLFIAGIYLPSYNKTDEMTGYVIAINNMKYLKLFCLALAYLTGMLIFYFAWMLAYAYIDINFITGFFRVGYYAMLVAILPLFIVITYILIANWVRDSKIKEMLVRGIKIR